jgi:hypothetical protein
MESGRADGVISLVSNAIYMAQRSRSPLITAGWPLWRAVARLSVYGIAPPQPGDRRKRA